MLFEKTIMGDQHQARSGYQSNPHPDRTAPLFERLKAGAKKKVRALTAAARRRLDKHDHDAEISQIRESGLFDADFYLAFYPEYRRQCDDAIEHYCRFGWREGKNPCDEFDTDFYLHTNPDIRDSGMNPFLHYVQAGVRELRQPRIDLKPYHEHDIWFGGLPNDIAFIAYYHSPDWQRFRAGRATSVSYAEPPLPIDALGFYACSEPDLLRRQADLARCHGVSSFCFDLAPAAGAEADPLTLFLSDPQIRLGFCVQLNPDRQASPAAAASALAQALCDRRYQHLHGRPVVFVRDSGSDACQTFLSPLRQALQQQGLQPFWIGSAGGEDPIPERHRLTYDAWLDRPAQAIPGESGVFRPVEKNGIRLVPYRVVVAQGIARALQPQQPSQPTFHAVTLGRHTDDTGAAQPLIYTRFSLRAFREWLDVAIARCRANHPEGQRLLVLDSWNDWNQGAILEPDRLFGYGRLNELTRAIKGIACGFVMPKVSVIVPNYNHEEFLIQRLESIYGQSHTNIEVLLLDDCSSDGSRAIMEEYARRYPEISRCLFNDANSGGAFRQWARGIKAASGKLIWIAESDDSCDADFLAKLVSTFEDESVLLAYSKSVFVDRNGQPLAAGFRYQVLDLPCGNRWLDSFVATAHTEVNLALGIKNTIPNASGVVFKRPVSMALLDDPEWLNMRVVGDWVFYLHLIRGGRVAFCETTNNYFRRYQGSTAESGYKQDYFYREAGLAASAVARLYNVPPQVHEQSRAHFLRLFHHHVNGDEHLFESWYGYQDVLASRSQRDPNIVVSTVGFYPGGAEILPIRFVNELKRRGCSVLLLSAGLHVREQGVREMLRNDVPLIETSDLHETRQAITDFGLEVLNSHQWQIQRYPFLDADIFAQLGCHVASLHGMIEHGNDFGVSREELLAADHGVSTWVYTADKNLGPFVDLDVLEQSRARFLKLPNGMQPPVIEPILRADIGIPDDAFVLCCVSRAIPEKGWAEAIEVVGRARQISGRDIHLILVGNGAVYEEYCSRGVPDYVYLAGFSDNSVGHYAAADMGIMLTRFKSESFPLTVVDCLFAGKPYLATDVGEIRNILTEQQDVAGAVLPLDDWQVPIEPVVEALLRFVSDSDTYQRAQQIAVAKARRFRIDEVMAQYLTVFEQDLGRDRRLIAPPPA